MENAMVVLQEKEPRAGTLIMSHGFGVEHRALRKLVIKYKTEFEELGIIASGMQKIVHEKRGRPVEEFLLNEEQSLYLGSLLTNNEIVRKFKMKLVKEFGRMKRALLSLSSQKQNAEWIEKRNSGKITRKQETDAIKVFIDYAKSQGSQSADKYYMIISKMENQALFLLEQEFPNLRQVLNLNQLSVVECADRIISKALSDGISRAMKYKDIYQYAKKQVESFSEIIGKTIIPAFGPKQLTAP